MFTITCLDEEMTKTKVVDLEQFYNFYVLSSSTTFMFTTFSFEIIYSFKMLFQVAIF
jgi:hypothetical protein